MSKIEGRPLAFRDFKSSGNGWLYGRRDWLSTGVLGGHEVATGTAIATPDRLFGPLSLDNVAHIIQVAHAPAILLSALAALLNVFSTRLSRVADQVDAAARLLEGADQVNAARLTGRLSHPRMRSLHLDAAVVLGASGGCLTGLSVLTLLVGAVRDRAAASVLFARFGLAIACLIGALDAFLIETLLAGRGLRLSVAQQQDEAAAIGRRSPP